MVYKVVARLMDQYMSDDVGRQLMEEYPIKTKSDLFLEDAQEGIVSLLRLWPDLKMKLHACFNNPLPSTLRQLAWRLFLENEKGELRLSTSPAIDNIQYLTTGHCWTGADYSAIVGPAVLASCIYKSKCLSSLSNVTVVDEKFDVFHQYLSHKSDCLFSVH